MIVCAVMYRFIILFCHVYHSELAIFMQVKFHYLTEMDGRMDRESGELKEGGRECKSAGYKMKCMRYEGMFIRDGLCFRCEMSK